MTTISKYVSYDWEELIYNRTKIIFSANRLLASVGLELVVHCDSEEDANSKFQYYFEIGYYNLLPSTWRSDNSGITYFREELRDRNGCHPTQPPDKYTPDWFLILGIEYLKATSASFKEDYEKAIRFYRADTTS